MVPGEAADSQRGSEPELRHLEAGAREHLRKPLLGGARQIDLAEGLLDRDLPGADDADEDVARAQGYFAAVASAWRK